MRIFWTLMKQVWNSGTIHFFRKIDNQHTLANLTVPYSHRNISARKQSESLQAVYPSWNLDSFRLFQSQEFWF
jgi:hypothetical protein